MEREPGLPQLRRLGEASTVVWMKRSGIQATSGEKGSGTVSHYSVNFIPCQCLRSSSISEAFVFLDIFLIRNILY